MTYGSNAAPNPKLNCTGTQLRTLVGQLDQLGLDPEAIAINTTVPSGAPAPAAFAVVSLGALDDDEPASYVLRFGESWINAAALIRTLSAFSSVASKYAYLWTQVRPGTTFEQAQTHLVSLAPVQVRIEQFLQSTFMQ